MDRDVSHAKPHLSASQLESFCRCPEAYRRRYAEGEIIPPGIAMLVGSGFHRGAEANMRQKVESREDMPAKEIVDMAVAGFEAEIGKGYILNDAEASVGSEIVIGEAKDSVATFAQLHAKEQAPDYQPIMVEHPVRIELPGPRDLVGIIDLADEQQRVTDFKTGGRRKSQEDADGSVQLTVYAAAFQVETGSPPSEVRLDTAVKTKTKMYRDVITSTRDADDFAALASRINVVTDAIDRGSFPPATPGAWWCSSRFCGYYSTCPFINPKRGRAAQND